MSNGQFHITKFPANEHWPHGGWSLYEITGDQIADRIIKEDGKVVVRHSWCGFIGCFDSLDGVVAAIAKTEGGEIVGQMNAAAELLEALKGLVRGRSVTPVGAGGTYVVGDPSPAAWEAARAAIAKAEGR